MTKLSDIQAVILSAAAQRDEGAVLPLPETLKIRGGAVDKVLGSLKAKGLIEHRGSRRGDNPPPLRITRAGLEAIGIEPEDAGYIQRGATEGARLADAADVEGRVRSGEPADTQPDPAVTRTPRAGTKQALMIELLKRPEGATVEQIAAPPAGSTTPFVVPSPERSGRSSALQSKRPATARSAPTRPAPRGAVLSIGSPDRVRRLGRHRRLAEGRSTTMHGLLKRPGYRLYAPDSPEARTLLAEQDLRMIVSTYFGPSSLHPRLAAPPGSRDQGRV